MTIVRKLRVNGALFVEVEAPKLDPRRRIYTAMIRHDDGREQIVYSRLPAGPFVFTEIKL